MPGLVPGIHVFRVPTAKTWTAGTSPAMTTSRSEIAMPATALDSLIFGDIFSTPEMRQVFSDENRTACYLAIEAALARVQGRLGIIPREAAREIDAKCKVENIDFG